MRGIKFRGLNLPTKEWKYGFLVVDEKYTQIWQEGDNPVPVDPKTVGQYIGVKDENKKEIYEHDIINFEDFHTGTEGDGDYFLNQGVVEYDEENALFTVSNRYEVLMDEFWLQDYIKIIGNIYENPELIK